MLRDCINAYWLILLAISTFSHESSTAFAQGTAFTYQGRLNNGSALASGSYDLQFGLYAAASAGLQQGNLLTNTATAVSNGLFTLTLDFGIHFSGADRWLELAVRTNGNGAFTMLVPRQQLTPTPYAIQAGHAATATSAVSAGSVSAANITGSLTSSQMPASVITNGASGVNISGTFAGNGASITNVSFSTLNSVGVVSWGNFLRSASPGVGLSPAAVISCDVNGDGSLDLISANYAAQTLSVLTNNGSGGFALAAAPGVSGMPVAVVALDLNGDGKLA
jgi:hypothetical protein